MASRVQVARALAANHGVRFNRGPGPDIRTDAFIINVESKRTLHAACARMRGFRGPVYIACANDADLEQAREVVEGKTIGLMNSEGRIVKESTRGRWP